MKFKIMAAAVAVIVVAAANCGCSAVPPGLQASGQVTPGRVSYGATSSAVIAPGERVVGADPDANVRFDLYRNADFHLHGPSSN
jgi:hypothetical protein